MVNDKRELSLISHTPVNTELIHISLQEILKFTAPKKMTQIPQRNAHPVTFGLSISFDILRNLSDKARFTSFELRSSLA